MKKTETRGRPSLHGEGYKDRATVTIDAKTRQYFHAMGGGNLSAGLRRVADLLMGGARPNP